MAQSELEKRYQTWPSEDLLRALIDKRNDYLPEAIAAMEATLRSRSVALPKPLAAGLAGSDVDCTCTDCGKAVGLTDTTCPHCGGDLTETEVETAGPLFLHISGWRLVIMSILSGGIYEAYWIYKNWQYVKERDGLKIHPFWRGIFGIFFCHSLLRRIHADQEAKRTLPPAFSPGGLATGWVALMILARVSGYLPFGLATVLAAGLMPSYLCLLPVQNYINAVSRKRRPADGYYRWSAGHFICITAGLLVWAMAVAALTLE